MKKDNTMRNIIMAVVAIAAIYFVYSTFISLPVSQSFVSWEQNGATVETARVNEEVFLNLDVYSATLLGYSGDMTIEIKKDLTGANDKIFARKTVKIDIPYGLDQKQTVRISFVPDEETGLVVREYFYKVYIGNKVIYDPTDSGNRNGLLVKKYASGGSVPRVTGVLFNNQAQIIVAPDTEITTSVKLAGTGDAVIKVEIRRDFGGMSDDTYIILEKTVSIDGTTAVEMSPTWIAKSVGGISGLTFRSYFARVYLNDELVYDPTSLLSPLERPHVRVASSTSPGTSPTSSISLKSVTWNIQPGTSAVTTKLHITGSYSGNVVVDVREDVSYWSDSNLASKTHTISGTNQDIDLTTEFATPAMWKWIFIRVPGIYDSTSPDARKSINAEIQIRETGTVGTNPVPTVPGTTAVPGQTVAPTTVPDTTYTTANTLDAGFGQNHESHYSTTVGTPIQVWLLLQAPAGTTSAGTVKAEVRKDYRLASDVSVIVLEKSYVVSGQEWILVGTFIPDERTDGGFFGGLNEYFVRGGDSRFSFWDYSVEGNLGRSNVKVT